MRRFLIKKTGDRGSPPIATPKKPKADAERLTTAKECEERRRPGFKAEWRDEFAWLTYEPAPSDSDANANGAQAATGSESSDGTKSKPQAYKMFCRSCRASYSVTAFISETPRPWSVSKVF